MALWEQMQSVWRRWIRRLRDQQSGHRPLSLPEEALKRITVTFAPVGTTDNRTPQLRLDGTVVATGNPIHQARDVDLKVDHYRIGSNLTGTSAIDKTYSKTYHEDASSYIAVGLSALQHADESLTRLRRELNDATSTAYFDAAWQSDFDNDLAVTLPLDGSADALGNRVVGTALSYTLARYWHDLQQHNAAHDALIQGLPFYSRVGSGIATSGTHRHVPSGPAGSTCSVRTRCGPRKWRSLGGTHRR